MNTIPLLTTLDRNYLPQLQVLLCSLHVNNLGDSFSLWLLHSGIPEKEFMGIRSQCGKYGYDLSPFRWTQSSFRTPRSPDNS